MGNPYDYLNGARNAETNYDNARVWRILTQVLRFRPKFESVELYYMRANALFNLKRYHLALKDIETAIDLDNKLQTKTESRATPNVRLLSLRMKIYGNIAYAENQRVSKLDQANKTPNDSQIITSHLNLRTADDDRIGELFSIVKDVGGTDVPECCDVCREYIV